MGSYFWGGSLGKKGKLDHEATKITESTLSGAGVTGEDYRGYFFNFSYFLRECGLLPKRVKEVNFYAFMLFVQFEYARGISPHSIGSMASAIRVILRNSGRKIGDIANELIGVYPWDRSGKKIPISDKEFEEVLARAKSRDEGLYHLLRIMRLFGLRSEEALRCVSHLEEWHKYLLDLKKYIVIKNGCKGGRERLITILPSSLLLAIEIVGAALAYRNSNGGYLVVGKRQTKEGSMNRLKQLYPRVGLTKQKSAGSLRYAFACDNVRERKSLGESSLSILGQVSEDLGHGARTRKRFTLTTYLQPVAHLLDDVWVDGRLRQKERKGESKFQGQDDLFAVPRNSAKDGGEIS
jgi:integrase